MPSFYSDSAPAHQLRASTNPWPAVYILWSSARPCGGPRKTRTSLILHSTGASDSRHRPQGPWKCTSHSSRTQDNHVSAKHLAQHGVSAIAIPHTLPNAGIMRPSRVIHSW